MKPKEKKDKRERKGLLERAFSVTTRRKIQSLRTDEEVELAIGWMQNIVSGVQVSTVMGFNVKNRASLYSFLVTALKQAFMEGKIGLNSVVKKVGEL